MHQIREKLRSVEEEERREKARHEEFMNELEAEKMKIMTMQQEEKSYLEPEFENELLTTQGDV